MDEYPNMHIDIIFKIFENNLNLKQYLVLALSMALLHSGIQTKNIIVPCSVVEMEDGEKVLDPTLAEWENSISKLFICFDPEQKEVFHMECS